MSRSTLPRRFSPSRIAIASQSLRPSRRISRNSNSFVVASPSTSRSISLARAPPTVDLALTFVVSAVDVSAHRAPTRERVCGRGRRHSRKNQISKIFESRRRGGPEIDRGRHRASLQRAKRPHETSRHVPSNVRLRDDGGAPGFDVSQLSASRESRVERERGGAEFGGEERFEHAGERDASTGFPRGDGFVEDATSPEGGGALGVSTKGGRFIAEFAVEFSASAGRRSPEEFSQTVGADETGGVRIVLAPRALVVVEVFGVTMAASRRTPKVTWSRMEAAKRLVKMYPMATA